MVALVRVSDVDLVVAVDDTTPSGVFSDPVAGLDLPGVVLYRRPKPRNAPAGGAYLAILVNPAPARETRHERVHFLLTLSGRRQRAVTGDAVAGNVAEVAN